MFSQIASFLTGLPATRIAPNTGRRATLAGGVPLRLLERAEARAGQDPHDAAELRRAAAAYLRVVR